MPSSYDSLRALACETPAEGGTQVRTAPTELDPTSDALAAAGLHLVGGTATANDKTVYVDRTTGGLRLTDGTTQRVLSELMTSVQGGVNEHAASRDIQHFLAGEGPGPGVAPAGAYCQRTYSGPLLASEIWYTTSSAATKILGRTLAYPSGSPLCSSETWTVYNAAGAAIRSLTDSYTYQGALRTSTLRNWS